MRTNVEFTNLCSLVKLMLLQNAKALFSIISGKNKEVDQASNCV